MIDVIVIQGEPVPKARPRVTRSGHVYTPKRTKDHEAKIIHEWLTGEHMIHTGAVSVDIAFKLKRPKGKHKEFPTKRPDIDNLIKTVLDGLNGLAFSDDSQVVGLSVTKEWADGAPCTRVEVADI